MTGPELKQRLEATGVPFGPRPARVLAACSGGTDSVALLALLRETPGLEVFCAHYNHGLRGAESDRDEAFVRELCALWGVPFSAGRGDAAAYAASRRLGVEEAARELRYHFLEETAKHLGCEYIATAHNAEDNAETVLLNLLRGAGARGLSGIPPRRELADGVWLVRPLLGCARAELSEILAARGLSHVEDSSNAGDAYARNRLRHRVFPLLAECNGAAVAHICAAAELLREDEEYLDGLAAAFLRESAADGALPLDALASLSKPVAMRALRRFAGSPGREHLERLYGLCLTGRDGASLDLPGGRFKRDGSFLRRSGGWAAVVLPRRELPPEGGTLALPEIGKTLACSLAIYRPGQEIYSSFNTFCFQSEKICGKITVASRTPGDRVRLAGRGCTKQVRRLLAEAGVPERERDAVPVFSDDQGVVAVAGFGVAERCAPVDGAEALVVRLYDERDNRVSTEGEIGCRTIF